MVKERPIIFNGEMVRAILDGRKTQTRRVVKPQPVRIGFFSDRMWRVGKNGVWCDGHGWQRRCTYGQPGDRLWVRETWQEFFADELEADRPKPIIGRMGIPAQPDRRSVVAYRADGDVPSHPEYGEALWRPSIHMPRWASRITLEVTDVRVERVQDISEEDAISEGLEVASTKFGTMFGEGNGLFCPSPLRAFQSIWDSINSKRDYSWEANPWVWVIDFRRVE